MFFVMAVGSVPVTMLTGLGGGIMFRVMEREPLGLEHQEKGEVTQQGECDANDGWLVVRSM